MTGWEEVGPDVYVRRYQPWDVNVGAVRASGGLLVVDTRANLAQGGELRSDLRGLDPRPPAWVVNTHCHFDHVFGNACFADAGAEIWGHASVPGALAAGRHDAPDDAPYRDFAPVPPQRLVSAHATLDLGDRAVELLHLGPGHTDGDLVVSVAGAGVVFAGDLIEESGPPAYGADSFPLDWPAALERLRDLALTDDLRFVPGHGRVVDRAFVEAQGHAVDLVARLVTELWEEGVSADKALDAGGERWPWPPERLDQAVRRAYAQLSEGVSGSGGTGG